ncbi:MAG: ATP-binding cassette domain-containing protein [Spirochaetes bacterium]|nr:ATP-binding cassette domain-containing protein [Spirochaetota bacterium]
MITVSGLSKHYGDIRAVDGIDFSINRKEIVGILGPNGAGKTTTLRMLTCFLTPTKGDASINGVSVYEDPIAIKKTIGYLPEMAPLYADMVVYDYLVYVSAIQELPTANVEPSIRYVVEKCGLREFISKKIGELSKGQKQRVGLAAAIIHNPEVLILDEPTSGLDPNQIIEIRSLIRELGKEKTVILSTHILPEVEATCDRVIIISRGKIVADSPTKDLVSGKDRPTIVTVELKTNASAQEIERVVRTAGSVNRVDVKDHGATKVAHIETPMNVDIREKLYGAIKTTDWAIYGMQRETQNLENIFHELTREA